MEYLLRHESLCPENRHGVSGSLRHIGLVTVFLVVQEKDEIKMHETLCVLQTGGPEEHVHKTGPTPHHLEL